MFDFIDGFLIQRVGKVRWVILICFVSKKMGVGRWCFFLDSFFGFKEVGVNQGWMLEILEDVMLFKEVQGWVVQKFLVRN